MQTNFNVKIDSKELSIKEQMKFYIQNRKPFMLHGASGLGKTRRVQELDPSLITIVLRNGMLPEEITGKTAYEGNKISQWIEPTWYTALKKVCEQEPDRNHVLFIDELTNVEPDVQALVFHIVLDRSIDGTLGRLPENCTVVAAGNNPAESSSAKPLTEPLFRRFESHIYLKADVKSFIRWGSELNKDGNPKIHPLVSRFIAVNGINVLYSEYDEYNLPKYAVDPRGWEQVSNIIYANNNSLNKNLIMNKIGPSRTNNLIAFASQKFISIEDIMNENFKKDDIPQSEDGQFALTCSLRMAEENQVEKVREFIKKYLDDEKCAIFDELWIEDNEERALIIEEIENKKGKSKKWFADLKNEKDEKDEKNEKKPTKAQSSEISYKDIEAMIDEFK